MNRSKDAIIIIPGIMGSRIFADGQITVPSKGFGDLPNRIAGGTRLWDPAALQLLLADEKILAIACDGSGCPVYPTKVAPPTVNEYDRRGGFQYGATDIYRRLYNKLYETFYGRGYDIVLFEYDWREDQFKTAEKLYGFIEEQCYANVVFVSHSIGGIVSSLFLSLGESAIKLTAKHISVGAPYLGSVEFPYILTTGNIRYSAFENMVISDSVAKIAANIPAVYMLLPFRQMWSPYVYLGKEGQPCGTFGDTLRTFEKYIPGWNKKLARLSAANRRRMFTKDGKHITSLVDSVYIVGTGVATTSFVRGYVDDKAAKPRFTRVETVKNNEGDGMVTFRSATVANTVPQDRLFIRTSSQALTAEHVGMVSGDDPRIINCDLSTIDLIAGLI